MRERRRKSKVQPEPAAEVPIVTLRALPVSHQAFSRGESFRQLASFTRLQFVETVKNVFFAVLVLAGSLFAIFSAYGINAPFTTPVYPVTWRMLELGGGRIRGLHSGDRHLLFRRTGLARARCAPQPDHGCTARAALGSVRQQAGGSDAGAGLLAAMVMVCGLIVQVAQGYHHFEFGLT